MCCTLVWCWIYSGDVFTVVTYKFVLFIRSPALVTWTCLVGSCLPSSHLVLAFFLKWLEPILKVAISGMARFPCASAMTRVGLICKGLSLVVLLDFKVSLGTIQQALSGAVGNVWARDSAVCDKHRYLPAEFTRNWLCRRNPRGRRWVQISAHGLHNTKSTVSNVHKAPNTRDAAAVPPNVSCYGTP